MMTRAVGVFALACFALGGAKSASPLSSFDDDKDHHRHNGGSAATYIYVQAQNGLDAFTVAANGALTPVLGSPFKTSGDAIGAHGSYLVSLDGSLLRSYPVEATGALGNEASSIDTAGFAGGGCGQARYARLDPTGQYVQVLYVPTIYVPNPCTAYLTFALSQASGAFTFLGDAVVQPDVGAYLDPLTMTGDGKFAYALNLPRSFDVSYAGFTRDTAGALANITFGEADPQPPSPFDYFSWLVEADSTNHLALALGQLEFFGSPRVTVGPTQLASYTVDATGNISSTNTSDAMPVPAVGPTLLRISPAGNLLAVAGNDCPWCQISVRLGSTGLQLFHFNGADPITTFTDALTTDPIDQEEWDSNNHLFAVSDSANKLYVFTATPAGVTAAPGSPYTIANPNGSSPNGLIVISTQTQGCQRAGKHCHKHSDDHEDDGEKGEKDDGDRD